MFGKRKAPPPGETLPGAREAGEGLVKIGGVRDPASNEPETAGPARQEIVEYLLAAYKDDRGIHVETVLSGVGGLAGFAAQMAVRKGMTAATGLPVEKLLVDVGAKDGRHYFFGDALNTIVAGNKSGQLSIWRLVGAPIVQSSAPLPDLEPIFKHVAATVGGPQFGIPALAAERCLKMLPIDALKKHWRPMQAILQKHGIQPLHWPLEIAMAAQDIIGMAKQSLNPAEGGKIVMESAIMMSKVDPAELQGSAEPLLHS